MRYIYCIVAIKTTVERYTFYLIKILSLIAPGFAMSRIIGSKQRSNLIRLVYIVLYLADTLIFSSNVLLQLYLTTFRLMCEGNEIHSKNCTCFSGTDLYHQITK
jgi:uncharacterized MAPEG superfamily protein